MATPPSKVSPFSKGHSAAGPRCRRPPNADAGGILAEQVEVFEDAVDDGGVHDEGDDTHHARAGRATQRVNLVHLLDEPRPIRLARVALCVFGLRRSERAAARRGGLTLTPRQPQLRLLPEASAAVGVAAVVDGHFLVMVGNVGREFGDQG